VSDKKYILHEASQHQRKHKLETSHHIYSVTMIDGVTVYINLANCPMDYKQMEAIFTQYRASGTLIITKGPMDFTDDSGDHISNMVMGG